jgi:hypothetical protein
MIAATELGVKPLDIGLRRVRCAAVGALRRRPVTGARTGNNAPAARAFLANSLARCAVALDHRRGAAFAEVVMVMGGRHYGRTVGTTVAPALSADAAVIIVVPGSWTPVPSPKSIK